MQGSYRRNFGPESVEELRKNIDVTYEEFLREDDGNKKADALRYMSAYAMQFLYLVPHDKKFLFKETERVLHQSSMNISDFDPREGSVSFECLAKYAHNILDQPWRTDFHTIKLTCGYFVHNISSQLHNAHEVLVAMGYVHTDETTLKLVPNFDFKRLKAVSKDMIIASQECLVLSQIWQRVADQEPDYPLTIGEVFEFRRKHLGDTDTICKTLISDIRRRHHEATVYNSTKNNRKFVPVDKLIEYEGMEGDFVDGKPENEGDIVKQVLRNTRMLHVAEEEHIYDPVYHDPTPNGRGVPGYPQSQRQHPYPYSSTENSAFAPNRKPSNPNYHIADVNYEAKARDSLSPMIPKTVSNFQSKQRYSYNPQQAISNSSSMSSISGSASRNSYSAPSHMPIKFSKVPPEEEHWNPERRDSKKINWSEFSGEVSGITSNDSRRHMHKYEKPDPAVEASRSRKPIMPGDVYPDDYFPRVVKPTPIHSSSTQNRQYRPPQAQYGDYNSDEDVMHEALAYASEIKGMTPKSQNECNLRSDLHMQAPPSLATKGGWETDSRSPSSDNSRFSSERDAEKRSASSTEPSSWGGTIQRQAGNQDHGYSGTLKESDGAVIADRNLRPSNIGVPVVPGYSAYDRVSESSPESINEAVERQHREYQESYKGVAYNTLSSSSSPSPKSPLKSLTNAPLTSEHLQNLDTVYYNSLLKSDYKNGEDFNDASVTYDQNLDTVYYNSLLKSDYKNGEDFNDASVTYETRSVTNTKQDTTPGISPPRGKSTGAAIESTHRSASERRQPGKSPDDHAPSPCNGIKTTSRIGGMDTQTNYNIATDKEKSLLDKRVVREPKRIAIESEVPVIQNVVAPWNCRFCTFKNTKSDRICEICFKSKDFFEEVEEAVAATPKLYSQPMPQELTNPPSAVMNTAPKLVMETKTPITCPQCTFLNYSNRQVCEVCTFRLRPLDSPELV